MEDIKNKRFKCYNLEINEDDNTEVNFVSLVEEPAIQMDWVAFSKDAVVEHKEKFEFKVANTEKRMITGIFMVPDKPIYRLDKKTQEEYFVKFTADNIERAVKKFQKMGYGRNIDTEHNALPNGCYIVDSWYIRDEASNPLKPFGFKEVPVGAWVGTVCVDNQEYWDEYIKTGELKGFSVMGLFRFGEMTEIQFSNEKVEDFTPDELNLIDKIADLLLDDEK